MGLALQPFVAAEDAFFVVVYKPHGWHTTHLNESRRSAGLVLLDWCAARYPEVLQPFGRKPCEGAVIHRLDYGTAGLVLFARTMEAARFFFLEQENGRFIKEYLAGSAPVFIPPPQGFPPPPAVNVFDAPFVVESAFRPYGPRSSLVRPALTEAEGGLSFYALKKSSKKIYRTEILTVHAEKDALQFKLRLKRGFRHQIRCHLAWLGRPVLNDEKYAPTCSGGASGEPLSLNAVLLEFRHPKTELKTTVAL
ncbi:MAG: RNA pseudouridine synthase [Spirochaetaceae bacterium]|nr:RNA pseudouridine synthase [Spirochaetaceae bacterium]